MFYATTTEMFALAQPVAFQKRRARDAFIEQNPRSRAASTREQIVSTFMKPAYRANEAMPCWNGDRFSFDADGSLRIPDLKDPSFKITLDL